MSAENVTFVRTLTNLDTIAIGFGAMIGFGWVVLTGGWLESAGTLGPRWPSSWAARSWPSSD